MSGGPGEREGDFKRLGYLSFDGNERSNHQVRTSWMKGSLKSCSHRVHTTPFTLDCIASGV